MKETSTPAPAVSSLDGTALSQEDRDLRLAEELWQKEKDAYYAETDGRRPAAPLLSPADRAAVKEILLDRFKIDSQFIMTFTKVCVVMKRRLSVAREVIAARAAAAEEGTEADVLRRRGRKPRISFARRDDSLELPDRHITRQGSSAHLLDERLTHWKLEQVFMEDDGNCQFRAMAHQLFDEAAFHADLRFCCVEHLRASAERFAFYFDGEEEWQRYLTTMAEDGTWGDELTLRAASSVFECNVHVVTSAEENYYLQYKLDDRDEDEPPAEASDAVTDIFLAYISPIHYNSIRLASQC